MCYKLHPGSDHYNLIERFSNESNHAIALVLASFPFLIGSKKIRVITQPIRNKLGIGIGLTSNSNCLVKAMMVLVLSCVTPSCLCFPFAYFYFFFIKKWPQDIEILVSRNFFGLTLAKTIRL